MKKNEDNIREGMVLSPGEVVENQVQIIDKEEFDRRKSVADAEFEKFLNAEEWRRHIEWKPEKKDLYAINEGENKYRVMAVKKYNNSLTSICHNQTNLDALFMYHPLLNSFKFNEFTQKNEFNDKRYDEDKQPAEIFNFFKRNFGEWCPRIDIKETIQETLNRNAYNPVKKYLEGLIWDGEERLETFLIDHYGAQDTKLNRTYFKRWMMALIKRIYYPGAKFDSMLILAGEQGKKKTTLFTWLGEIDGNKYWNEVPDNLSDVNSVVYATIGKFIMTFDDFDDICNKGQIGKVKSFITNVGYTAALKWQHDKDYWISYVLGASTNEFEMLVDDGAKDERRFWIVEVQPHTDIFTIPDSVKDQLFAEAYHKFMEDENQPLWIWEDDLKEEERQLQKKFKKAASDVAVEKILNIFNRKYPITDGMFSSEDEFMKMMEKTENDIGYDELTYAMNDQQLQYIKVIPSAWVIKYIGKDKFNRGTNRIVQILYNQGINANKRMRYWIYDKYLTVIEVTR